MKLLDLRKNLKAARVMNCTDAVFCGKSIENLAIAGCGDGNILSFNLDDGKCLYGYGADPEGAIHCLDFCPDLSG